MPRIWFFLLVFLCPFIARAQESAVVEPNSSGGPVLRVASRQIAPFVFESNGKLTGFSVELWDEIAQRLGARTQWSFEPNARELVNRVAEKKADVGISAVSITAEREQRVDFSQPMFDSGLQILARSQNSAPSLLSGFLEVARSPLMLQFAVAVLILVLVPSHVLWLLERRADEGIIRNKSYFPGIFEAAWWTLSCLATQAEEMPRTAFARILALIWMFFTVVFIAYVTAALTANLTLQTLRGDIQGPQDLPGKRVASVEGSTSADFLRARRVRLQLYKTPDEAFAALRSKKADAVVYDAPILAYYALHEGAGEVELVGSVFQRESYGIALVPGSSWRKKINYALLSIREDGTFDRLSEKYFGASE